MTGHEITTTPTQQGLIAAGLAYPGAHVCESQQQPLLMQLALEHAIAQARGNRQSHDGFAVRAARIRDQLGDLQCAEICAESWPEQANASSEELGKEMFHCWEQSPGHWSVASKKHKYWGGCMAQSRRGIWYACILVAD